MTKRGLSRGSRPGEPDDFGFDHDAALVAPRPGGIARLGIDVRGLPARLALRPRLDHRGLGAPRQDRVFRHGDDVVEARVRRRGSRGSPGVANPPSRRTRNRALRKRRPAAASSSRRSMPRAPRVAGALPGRRIAAHRYCSASSLKVTKASSGQIAPAVVVAVEERELLRAVGRVIGRIEIDRDAPRAAMQPLLMPRRSRSRRARSPSHRAPARRRRFRSARSWVARRAASPSIGSRPSSSLWIGSSASRSASFASG